MTGLDLSPNPWVDSEGRQLPYTWSWSVGVNHQIGTNAAIGADYVANISRDQMGIIDINEPVNGVRPGPGAFDPTGALIPLDARGTTFQRVLQVQTRPLFDSDYKSLQLSFLRRMANRWSGRLAYTFPEGFVKQTTSARMQAAPASEIRMPAASDSMPTRGRITGALAATGPTCSRRAARSTCGRTSTSRGGQRHFRRADQRDRRT